METVISHGWRYHPPPPPPFSRFMEGIVTVLGDMVVWDCARRIGILSRFVWYPCEFDSRIDIALRSGSIISSLYYDMLEGVIFLELDEKRKI